MARLRLMLRLVLIRACAASPSCAWRLSERSFMKDPISYIQHHRVAMPAMMGALAGWCGV